MTSALALLSILSCGPPPRRPSIGEQPEEAEDRQRPGRPQGAVLRFHQSEELLLLLDERGFIYSGDEFAGSVDARRLLDPEGQTVATMPETTGPILSGDGGELPFVLLEDGTLLVEGQSERATISEDGRLHYPGLVEEVPVTVSGVTDDNRRLAMLLVLFQSGYLSDTFRAALKRAKAREATTNLGLIADGLERAIGTSDAPTEPLGPTPEPGCDERSWPPEADPRWGALGFEPTAVRYSYRVEPEPSGYRLVAEGDLDCDGTAGRYELTLDVSEGNEVTRSEPTSDDPLE